VDAGDVGITEYDGGDPDRESVVVILDGFRHQRGVERDVNRLLSLTRVPAGADHPPVFRIHGGGLRLSGRRVVLETLEFGEVVERRKPDDVPTRQSLTLGLMAHVTADQLKISRREGEKSYTTVQGDTLRRVAAKQLGPHEDSPHNVREYARTLSILNDIRDVNRRLEPGTKLRLP
jgi:hypothetical protein